MADAFFHFVTHESAVDELITRVHIQVEHKDKQDQGKQPTLQVC